MMSIASNSHRSVSMEGIDFFYHFCIALLPILCLLNVPILNISLGTVLLLLFVPHAILYIVLDYKAGNPKISPFFFFLFYFYLILRSDGSITHCILCVATFINLFGIVCGSIKTERIRKYIEIYALINAALILLQVLVYYSFHVKIQYLPRALFHRDFQDSYVFRQSTGLYRPSALFLEPAHFSQYCCFALISALFPREGKVNWKKAGFIAMGCVLSTSGMGILFTCVIFGWFFLVNRTKKSVKLYKAIMWSPVVLIGLLIIIQVPFVQTAIQRVFSDVNGYNAFRGRTRQWTRAIAPMSGATLWFGYGNSADYPYYLTGLADTIYKFGILGAAFEFACFLFFVFRKFDGYIWCCCFAFLGLFCVAHLTSFYTQVFYLCLVASEALASKRRPPARASHGGEIK